MADQTPQPQPGAPHQVNIELNEKEAEGIYSNLVLISHSGAEFVLDFTRILPGVPKTRVYARIVMAPPHAKALCAALKDNIEQFEKEHGEIRSTSQNGNRPYGFQVNPPGNSR